MADYQPFPAKIVAPQGVIFEGQVRELELPSASGGLGVLARRSPIVADLKVGTIRALLEDQSWQTWATQEGFAQASDSTTTVVVEDAIRVDLIEREKAQSLVDASKERLEAAQGGEDQAEIKAAERALAWGEHLLALI